MLSNGRSRKDRRREHLRAWTHHECPPLTHIEYNIYSYSNDADPRAWRKWGSTDKPESAFDHAEELYKSGQYKKVEVKQRYFDSKTQRNVDQICRVFEAVPEHPSSSWLMPLAALSIMMVFIVTYALRT